MITTNHVQGLDRERERKFAYVEVTYDALAKMLDLPLGSSIVSVADRDDNSLRCKIVRRTGKDIMEGAPIPEMAPGQGDWEGLI